MLFHINALVLCLEHIGFLQISWLIFYITFVALLYYAVVNLTLIDLPGLTKVAVGKYLRSFNYLLCSANNSLFTMNLLDVFVFAEGQPESIVRDIEDMVRSYVEKVNKISLCFSSFCCSRNLIVCSE